MSENTMKRSKFASFWVIGLIINLGLILGLYYTEGTIGIDDFSDNISLPLYTIIPGILVLLGIWSITISSRIKEIQKKSLILLVVSFTLWFAAEQTWNLYEHVLDIDPYPSIADFFYLAAPITMFFSLVLFLKPFKKQISKKIIVFASIISIVVLIPTLIATYTFGIEGNFFEIFIALLYPIVDSILLVPAIVAISFTILNKRNLFWGGILIGILVLIAADVIFLFAVIDDTYVDGHPVDILFISSYTVWMFVMYYIINNSRFGNKKEVSITENKKYKINKFEKYGVIITIITINVMVGIILISMNYYLETNPEENITTYFSWTLIMLVVIFSSFVIVLNSKLNITLQKRSRILEKTTENLVKAERFSAIGTLASRLAHDLRNPLGIIMTSNSMIKKKSTDEQILKNTEFISRSVNRMEHQINNVLDFVRVHPIKIEESSIHELIHDSLKNMQIPEGVIIITIVFVLLIPVNVFATDITITEIETNPKDIPEDLMEKVFEPLFTTKHQGTGLGLASCKQIIHEHQGTIHVENNPTTFVIKIPREITK